MKTSDIMTYYRVICEVIYEHNLTINNVDDFIMNKLSECQLKSRYTLKDTRVLSYLCAEKANISQFRMSEIFSRICSLKNRVYIMKVLQLDTDEFLEIARRSFYHSV